MEEERELPEIEIEGTVFLVDVQRNILRQKENPDNELYIFDMKVHDHGYSFWYDKNEKGFSPTSSVSKNNAYVTISPLIEIDPTGMAEKYGYSVEHLKGKTDYDVMVNEDALALRMHGKSPTIDIAGYLFYVDYRMEMLRPENDLQSNGITFEDLEEFYEEHTNTCLVPYDPERHETGVIDYRAITETPKDLIAVSIPLPRQMDPVAYCIQNGFDLEKCLMEYGMRLEFKAEQVPWEKTGIMSDIKRNRVKMQAQKWKSTKKKGRGL